MEMFADAARPGDGMLSATSLDVKTEGSAILFRVCSLQWPSVSTKDEHDAWLDAGNSVSHSLESLGSEGFGQRSLSDCRLLMKILILRPLAWRLAESTCLAAPAVFFGGGDLRRFREDRALWRVWNLWTRRACTQFTATGSGGQRALLATDTSSRRLRPLLVGLRFANALHMGWWSKLTTSDTQHPELPGKSFVWQCSGSTVGHLDVNEWVGLSLRGEGVGARGRQRTGLGAFDSSAESPVVLVESLGFSRKSGKCCR